MIKFFSKNTEVISFARSIILWLIMLSYLIYKFVALQMRTADMNRDFFKTLLIVGFVVWIVIGIFWWLYEVYKYKSAKSARLACYNTNRYEQKESLLGLKEVYRSRWALLSLLILTFLFYQRDRSTYYFLFFVIFAGDVALRFLYNKSNLKRLSHERKNRT